MTLKFKDFPEISLGIVISSLYIARFAFVNTNIYTISFLHITALKLICIFVSIVVYIFVSMKILLELFRNTPYIGFLNQYLLILLEKFYYSPLRKLGLFILAFPRITRDLIISNFNSIHYLYQIHFIILFYFILPRIWLMVILYYDIIILHTMLLTSTLMFYTAVPLISQGFLSLVSLYISKNIDTNTEEFTHICSILNIIYSQLKHVFLRIFFLIYYLILTYCWINFLVQL